MARILVTQLARMGDLVQSLYLLEDLTRAEGHKVSLLVDRRLEGFARIRAPWVETVFPLDLEKTLAGFRKGLPWKDLWETLREDLQALRGGSFDRVINLNYGKLAASVADAVCGPVPVEGFHSTAQGLIGGPWEDLISRLVQADRRWNRFHLVDVFRFHAARKVSSQAIRTKACKALGHGSVLAVQVATRGLKRTWKPEGFIEVIRGLQEEVGCEVLLLGESRERPLAEAIVRQVGSGRVRDLAGKTSLDDLVEILLGCDRLLSGDTGTLHLACRLGVPSLALFFGPAYTFETGPYGSGHFVVQAEPSCAPCREDGPCRDRVCVEEVVPPVLLSILKGERVEPSTGVTVYASGFVGDWMQYRPLHRKRASLEDVTGYLHWGCAGEFLGTEAGRLPSVSAALEFLAGHYRLEEALLDRAGSFLDSALPRGMRNRDRERLRPVLHNAWCRLREMTDECTGQEPCRPEASAA